MSAARTIAGGLLLLAALVLLTAAAVGPGFINADLPGVALVALAGLCALAWWRL